MIKKADYKIRVFAVLGITIFSIFYIFPIQKKVNLGLDLKGGMYVLLHADTSSLPKDKESDAISGAIEKIRNRIDAYGVKETSIQIQGDKSILIQVPGVVDRSMIDQLKEVGKLEFKLVEEDKEKNDAALKGEVAQGYQLKDLRGRQILLEQTCALTGADLESSYVGFDSLNTPSVKLSFTPDGGKKFAKVTESNVGKQLAIILDDKVMSAPQIQTPILNGQAEITGDFSLEEARLLTSVLNSGALPVPLIVEEERTVGPILGSDSIKRGINSILLGAAMIIIFMLIYYFLGGVIAIICLALDLIFILAGLNMLRGTLTLPGIAGMILTLGMAVDANVLIFERIREELELKKPLSVAVKNGFDKAKRTIFDANITTLIAAVFLFIYGTGPIRGFATTLSLGIIASIFTSIFVGRTVFALFLDLKLKKFPMLHLINSAKINFVGLRKICIILSLIAIAVSTYSFYQHRNTIYGVDFQGGQILEYQLKPAPNIENVRAVLKENGLDQVNIQEFKDIEGGIIIKSKDDIANKVEKILSQAYQTVEKLKVTLVGPTVGKVLKKKALFAILLSLLGMLIYVGFRFKHFDFAFAAIVALFHDVILSLCVLSFTHYEINLLTITALLTIAGYSINDTIVIYDRIREVGPRMTKMPFKDVINFAINNTLSRTIITSFTTIMVVVSIYLLGGEALKDFSFVLLVGFIAGTYSSIFIASPLVLFFRRRHLHV